MSIIKSWQPIKDAPLNIPVQALYQINNRLPFKLGFGMFDGEKWYRYDDDGCAWDKISYESEWDLNLPIAWQPLAEKVEPECSLNQLLLDVSRLTKDSKDV